jgi:hypothetical protein
MASSYGSVSIPPTTATLIVAANCKRQSITITNNSITDGYIGMDSSVTDSNGLPLYGNQTREKDRNGGTTEWQGAIYGYSPSGTLDFRYWEYER